MTQITCPKCRKQISPSAASCPYYCYSKNGIVFCLFLILSSCSIGVKTKTLENCIRSDYQEQIDNQQSMVSALVGVDLSSIYNEIGYDLHPIVKEVSIVHIDRNQYRGIATIQIGNFEINQRLSIIYDGDNYYWEVDQ